MVKEKGPALQARPICSPVVAVLYTDPVNGDRARQLFENSLRQRLDHLEASASFVLSSVEREADVARSLQHLLRGGGRKRRTPRAATWRLLLLKKPKHHSSSI